VLFEPRDHGVFWSEAEINQRVDEGMFIRRNEELWVQPCVKVIAQKKIEIE
jgi:hypothetical protein